MQHAIATPVASDAATLTASSESPALPASNLLTIEPFDRWRTLAAQAYLTIDLGSAQLVRLVWLGYTNATSSATWRVRAADTEANLTAAPLYDSGTLSHWPTTALGTWARSHAFLWLPAATAHRWWRIDVDNVGASYYEAGRLYLSDPWVPSRPMDFGARLARVDASTMRRANSGTGYVRMRGTWREGTLQMSYLEREELFKRADELERRRGSHADVLVMCDTEQPRYFMEQSLYGILTDLGPIVAKRMGLPPGLGTLQPLFEKSWGFEELEHP